MKGAVSSQDGFQCLGCAPISWALDEGTAGTSGCTLGSAARHKHSLDIALTWVTQPVKGRGDSSEAQAPCPELPNLKTW